MKKFLVALAILFIVNLGCKKIIDQPLCACSPIGPSPLALVIKNAAGDDLLSAATTGSFAKDQIQLYRKDEHGNIKQVVFYIRPPFDYGTEKFTYNQLLSTEIIGLTKSVADTFYLKLGDQVLYELNLQITSPPAKVEKLLIDHKDATAATGSITNYTGGNIFYLVKK